MLKLGRLILVTEKEIDKLVDHKMDEAEWKANSELIKSLRYEKETKAKLFFTVRDIEDYLESNEMKEIIERGDFLAEHVKNKIEAIIRTYNYRPIIESEKRKWYLIIL